MNFVHYQKTCKECGLRPASDGSDYGAEMIRGRVTAHYHRLRDTVNDGTATVFGSNDSYTVKFSRQTISTVADLRNALISAKSAVGGEE